MPPSPGLFLTIEGIEGAGKSTQAQLLASALEAAGRDVLRTFEPGGGGPLGAELRRLLKDPGHWRTMELSEIYLYAAARAYHVESTILPALAAARVVLCDRYLDSTRAYQGHGRGRPLALIESLHALPPLDLAPRRTVLLDIAPAAGLARARHRGALDEGAGYDDEDLQFFGRVRDGFLAIAEREPGRVRVIDADAPVATVHARIVEAVAGLVPGLAPLAVTP